MTPPSCLSLSTCLHKTGGHSKAIMEVQPDLQTQKESSLAWILLACPNLHGAIHSSREEPAPGDSQCSYTALMA